MVTSSRCVVVLIIHSLVTLNVVVIVKQHLNFLLVVLTLTIPAIVVVVVARCLILIVVAIIVKFFELVCVSSANKLTIHVKYLALRIHQKFTLIAFNLDSPHDNIILHINTNLLVCLGSFAIKLISLISLIFIECALRIVIILLLASILIIVIIIFKALIILLVRLLTLPKVIIHIHMLLHIVIVVLLVIVSHILWLILIIIIKVVILIELRAARVNWHTIVDTILVSFSQVLIHLIGLIYEALSVHLW